MTVKKIREFAAPDHESISALLREMENTLFIQERRTNRFSRVYLDTFCRSLFNNGILLRKQRGKLHFTGPGDQEAVAPGVAGKKHFFAWDIEDGVLDSIILQKTGIRALSPICQEKVEKRRYDLLNNDKKTVARLYVETIAAKDGGEEKPVGPIIALEGVRGYEKQFDKVFSILIHTGMQEIGDRGRRLQYLLNSLGGEVGSYSSKYSLDLPDDVSLSQAVSTICLYLVQAMEVNLPGVLEDIDSEFLHDFRIAVRRTRSLLSQLKKQLPADEIGFFQNEFKWLGSITGPVRDLDVYLLMREEYRQMLPQQLQQGLEEFFEELEKERVTALEAMRKELRSSRYTELMTRWKAFHLGENGGDHRHAAEDLCRPVARNIIRKRFRKIIRSGSKIGANSPDDDLHSLRIQGKKLRYMLEFFRSFFDLQEIDFFHGQLKKLQNNLGDFNDISVQLEMLEEHLGSLSGRGKRSLRIAGAIGGLITVLTQRHRKVRRKFEKTFAAFASEENRARFNNTLK